MPSEMIKCVDARKNPDICEQEFEFTEREQAFFDSKGLHRPKRCIPCRDKKKQRFNDRDRQEDHDG